MNRDQIESVFPLTQIQTNFLWHSLEALPDRCLVHVFATLQGRLNSTVFKQAWQEVVRRQPILRTSVHWEKVKKPVQIVAKQSTVPFQYLDWRDETNFAEQLEQWIDNDKRQGLELTNTPVFRVSVVSRSEYSHELVWLCHHLLLDGWSGALVLQDVLSAYDDLVQQRAPRLLAAPSFQAYVRWKAQQNTAVAEEFWRQRMAGVHQGTPLPSNPSLMQRVDSSAASDRVLAGMLLSEKDTAALQAQLRQSRLTLNSLMQGVWALILAHQGERSDVVFGTTVSGRQIEFPDADRVAGLLINVLPVRVLIQVEAGWAKWLLEIQSRHLEAVEHSQVEPASLQSLDQTKEGFFNTLLVVENQPVIKASGSLQVSNPYSGTVSNSSLLVIVKPGEKLAIDVSALRSVFTRQYVQGLLDQFQNALSFIIKGDNNTTVGDLSESLIDGKCLNDYQAASMNRVDSIERQYTHFIESENEDSEKHSADVFTSSDARALGASRLEIIRNIWLQVLPVQTVSDTASFFDLGGTSIQALRVFDQIESTLGVKLPVTTLFKARSVSLLAQVVSEELPASDAPVRPNHAKAAQRILSSVQSDVPSLSTLVEIQVQGDRPPLFIIDTVTDILVYRHLSYYLGKNQPVYALAARAYRDRPFADLAVLLANEIMTFYPKGKLALAGASGGGVLAWEVVQYMESQGRQVKGLVLFDSFGPGFPQLLPPVQRIASVFRYLCSALPVKMTGQLAQLRVLSKSWCSSQPVGQVEAEAVKFAVNTASPVSANSVVSAARLSPATDSENSNQAATQAPDSAVVEAINMKNNSWSNFLTKISRAKHLIQAGGQGRGLWEKCINALCMLILKLPVYSINIALPVFVRGLQLEYEMRKQSSLSGSSVRPVSIQADEQNPYDMNTLAAAYSRMYTHLGPLQTPVTYFMAESRPPATRHDPAFGWGGLLQDKATIFPAPGNHVSIILEPHVRQVAELMQPMFD